MPDKDDPPKVTVSLFLGRAWASCPHGLGPIPGLMCFDCLTALLDVEKEKRDAD